MTTETDLSLLPSHLQALSLRREEIVLPFAEAVLAVDELSSRGVAVVAWEGWLQSPDGAIGHSSAFQGTVEVRPNPGESRAAFVKRARGFAVETMRKDYQRSVSLGENAGMLFFCLSLRRA